MTRRPLTIDAQQAIAAVLGPGDLAVDTTVGNGHDTLFLARCIAPHGRVFGFDVQQTALSSARSRLAAAGLAGLVDFELCGHERMRERLPAAWHGRVAAVMFNLGYLPGADKTLVTRAETTLAALDQAVALLRPGGLISLLLYRDHAGAADEVAAVEGWLGRLDRGLRLSSHASPGPVLHLLARPA
jgi:SAM-dependent methyltransferase